MKRVNKTIKILLKSIFLEEKCAWKNKKHLSRHKNYY